MNKKQTRAIAAAVTLSALAASPLFARAADDDMAEIRKAIEALMAGQQQLSKDVAEIKKLVSPKPRPQPIEEVEFTLNVADDPFKGDAGAELTLVEFTDYQCPFCARHVKTVMPDIKKNYLDTGKVKYVLKDFPLPFHKEADEGAQAAHCAGDQGKYWEMHGILFENQKAMGPEHLAQYAEQLALDTAVFQGCMESGKYAEKVKQGMAEGSKMGVSGTPTMFLGKGQPDGSVKLVKRLRGALPFNSFQQNIDGMLD